MRMMIKSHSSESSQTAKNNNHQNLYLRREAGNSKVNGNDANEQLMAAAATAAANKSKKFKKLENIIVTPGPVIGQPAPGAKRPAQEAPAETTLALSPPPPQLTRYATYRISSKPQKRYRVGDWVYVEYEPEQPFSIRKIEEFTRDANGIVSARMRCAFRYSDIPPSLLLALEKSQTSYFSSIQYPQSVVPSLRKELDDKGIRMFNDDENDLKALQLHRLRSRELFYSKFSESNVPVENIKGRLELNIFFQEIDKFTDFIEPGNEDRFFYQINYDPNMKVLSIDRPHIRVGQKYQADIPELFARKNSSSVLKREASRETLVWAPPSSSSSSSSSPQSSPVSAINFKLFFDNAFKKRRLGTDKYRNSLNNLNDTDDTIKYQALMSLYSNKYDAALTLDALNNDRLAAASRSRAALPSPEEAEYASDEQRRIAEPWSIDDTNAFRAGITEGKDFQNIRKKHLPHKSLKSIVEYYYNNWKRSVEYIEKRKLKRAKKESGKLLEITEHDMHRNEDLKSARLVNKRPPTLVEAERSSMDASRSVKTFICDSCKRSKLNFSSPKSPTHDYDHHDSFSSSSSSPNGHNFKFIIRRDSFMRSSGDEGEFSRSSSSSLHEESPCASPLKENLHAKYSILAAKPEAGQPPAQQRVQLYQYKRHVGDSQTSNLCNDCWIYWKKYGTFKYNIADSNVGNGERAGPDQRKERLKQQSFRCSADACGRKFKTRQDLAKHALFSHALVLRTTSSPTISFKDLHNFCLKTSPYTKAATRVFAKSRFARSFNSLRRLARQPVAREVDVDMIQHEWDAQMAKGNVEKLLARKHVDEPSAKTRRLGLIRIVSNLKKNAAKYHSPSSRSSLSSMSSSSAFAANTQAKAPRLSHSPLSPSSSLISFNDSSISQRTDHFQLWSSQALSYLNRTLSHAGADWYRRIKHEDEATPAGAAVSPPFRLSLSPSTTTTTPGSSPLKMKIKLNRKSNTHSVQSLGQKRKLRNSSNELDEDEVAGKTKVSLKKKFLFGPNQTVTCKDESEDELSSSSSSLSGLRRSIQKYSEQMANARLDLDSLRFKIKRESTNQQFHIIGGSSGEQAIARENGGKRGRKVKAEDEPAAAASSRKPIKFATLTPRRLDESTSKEPNFFSVNSFENWYFKSNLEIRAHRRTLGTKRELARAGRRPFKLQNNEFFNAIRRSQRTMQVRPCRKSSRAPVAKETPVAEAKRQRKRLPKRAVTA